MLFALGFAFPAGAGAVPDLPATGCRPPTPVEPAWADAHMSRTEQVRLNRLALTRLNDERAGPFLHESRRDVLNWRETISDPVDESLNGGVFVHGGWIGV